MLRPVSAADRTGIEAGALLTGNLSGTQTYLSTGPAAFASLRVGRWMLGISTRWHVYQRVVDKSYPRFEMQTLSTSVDMGRRLVDGRFTLDAGLGPWFTAESQSVEEEQVEKGGMETDLAIGAFARAQAGAVPLRWAFSLDGAVSPLRVRRSTRIDDDLPPMPSFTIGLGVGAAWSEP